MTPLLLALFLVRPTLAPVDVIANVRKAVGVTSEQKGWQETVLTGSSEFHGVTNRYKLQFREGGKFTQSIEGRLGQTLGSDGMNFWQIDSSGATRHLAFEDVDRVQTVLFLLTDYWLDPKAPVDITTDGLDPKTGTYAAHVNLHISGLDETVRIDPKTWLPTSAEFEIASSKTTIVLSDWHRAGAVSVPYLARVTDEGMTDTFRVEEARAVPTANAISYSMPSLVPKDTSYDSSIPSRIETRRAVSGHILVHPKVNGQDIGWFILDSGADSMVIDKVVADKLKLPKMGKEPVVGVGGVVQAPFRTANEFSLGPGAIRNINFIEVELGDLSSVFKVPLAGIVGFDFFRRFIVQVDLKNPSVEVNNVLDYHLPRGDWTKMEFSTGNPAVQATFEGDHKAWFRLDTGANGTLTFHAPAVQKMHMLEGRETTPAEMAGVGGSTEARAGNLAWFELGGHRFKNISVVFSLAKTGAFADHYFTGNIGQDLMEPFTVVFDFGGSRVAFLPR